MNNFKKGLIAGAILSIASCTGVTANDAYVAEVKKLLAAGTTLSTFAPTVTQAMLDALPQLESRHVGTAKIAYKLGAADVNSATLKDDLATFDANGDLDGGSLNLAADAGTRATAAGDVAAIFKQDDLIKQLLTDLQGMTKEVFLIANTVDTSGITEEEIDALTAIDNTAFNALKTELVISARVALKDQISLFNTDTGSLKATEAAAAEQEEAQE